MAGEIIQKTSEKKKRGAKRQRRRLGVRVDMTPMVDIAFLLLIFYMVTTVFTMPQAMEINLPPSADAVPVKHLLTLRVDAEGRYWWNMGKPTSENLPQLLPTHPDTPDSVDYLLCADTLRGLLESLNLKYDSLNTLLLIHTEARYSDWVNILDEIDMLERKINSDRARAHGVEVRNLPRDRAFSYRFALGDWEDGDNRLIADARRKSEK